MAFLTLYIMAALAVGALGQEQCPIDGANTIAVLPVSISDSNSHYYIGGSFGLHNQGPTPYTCGTIRERGVVNSEAFFWAIKKYASRAGLTTAPKPVSVGGFVMDSCTRKERTIQNVFSFDTCKITYNAIQPRNTVAFVGPDRSDEALDLAPLLSDMERLLVSNAATSPELNNTDFNYFLRTVPSDDVQTDVMARLLTFRAIKYVQVLYSDNAYGMGLYNAFKKNIMNRDICITNAEAVDADNMTPVVNKLTVNPTYVIILSDNQGSAKMIKAIDNNNNLRGRFVFVGTSSWGRDPAVISTVVSAENAITLEMDTSMLFNFNDVTDFWTDFFQMLPNNGSNSGQPRVNSYNPWFSKFWEDKFKCSFALATCNVTDQNLRDVMDGSDAYVPFTLLAVDAIIKGVTNASITVCGDIHLCSNLLNVGRGKYIRSGVLAAKTSGGNSFFQKSGEASSLFQKYKVLQVQDGDYKEVYRYDPNDSMYDGFQKISTSTLVTPSSTCNNDPCRECNETAIITTEAPTTKAPVTETTTQFKITKETKKSVLADYFKADQEFTGIFIKQARMDNEWQTRFEYGQDWIIALGVLAGLGIVCVVVFEIYILYKLMGTKIGKQWRTMWLGQLLLFSLFCCYLTLFAYLPTPTKATCGITRFGVGVSYSMCFAVLLVKLMVLLTSKTSSDTLIPGDVDSPNYLRGIYQFLMFVFVVGVQVVIAIQWLIHVPPEAVKVITNNGDEAWICNHYTWSIAEENNWNNMTTFVRNEFENHLISLVYIMFLIVLTTIVSMSAHGIITNHRESVFIGIAAGFTIPVWLAWGLIGGLNREHEFAQEFGDCCIAFGLFITATLILFSMFLPKVRQLVNMGVEGIYLEDDRDTYYAGSVIMAPPSYKSRPSSVVYVNGSGYNDPITIGDPNAVHLKHPGSNYSAPVYVKRPDSTIGGHSGKVLRMTGDLTGKHPRESKRSTSEFNYGYAGSGYGTYRKSQSERGTLRRAHSSQDLGAL